VSKPSGRRLVSCRTWPNCYSTTAGSFIQILFCAQVESFNSFVINKTRPE
jgi:hypothetical protein